MSWLDSLLGAIPFVSQSGGGKLQPDPFAGLNVIGATLAKNAATGNVDLTIPPGGSLPQFVTALSSYAPADTSTRQFLPIDGYASTDDGGGGTFGWNPSDTRGSDGGTIVAVTGIATGRWNRVYSGPLSVKWFGAVGNGSADDTSAIHKCDLAAQVAGGTVYFPPGTYACTTITLHGRYAPEQGVILAPSVVANIYGPIVASPTQQVFSSTARVVCFDQSAAGRCESLEVYAAWWGAVGDGTTDNTSAFRYSLLCAMTLAKQSAGAYGGKLKIGRGQFRCTDTPLTVIGDSTDGVAAWQSSHVYGTVQTCVMSGGYLWGLAVAGTSSTGAPTATAIGQTFVDGTCVWRCLAVPQPTGSFGASGVIIEGEDTGGSQPQNTLLLLDFTEDSSGTTATVDGSGNFTEASHTFTAADVGSWIFVSTSAHAGNVGAWRVSAYTSAHVVVLVDPTGEATWTADAGAMTWVMPRRSGVRIWSRDCVVRGFQIQPSAGKAVLCGYEDTISPIALVGASSLNTNNDAHSLVCTGNGAVLIHARSHGDNPVTPNANFVFGNCDFSHDSKCQFLDSVGFNWYMPNSGGETVQLLISDHSVLSSPDVLAKNPRGDIYLATGNVKVRSSSVASNQIGVYTGAGNIDIDDLDAEGLARLYKQPNSSGTPLRISVDKARITTDRIASDGVFIRARSANQVELIGIEFNPTFVSNFSINVEGYDGGPIVPASLTAIDCVFPSSTPFALSTNYLAKLFVKNCQGCRDVGGVGYPIANIEQTSSATSSTAAAATIEEVTIPSGQQVTIKFRLSSRDRSSVGATHCTVQEIIGSFVNVSGTVTQIGTTQSLFTAQGSGSIVASFAISGAIVECQFTQSGTDNWSHVARVETEINF